MKRAAWIFLALIAVLSLAATAQAENAFDWGTAGNPLEEIGSVTNVTDSESVWGAGLGGMDSTSVFMNNNTLSNYNPTKAFTVSFTIKDPGEAETQNIFTYGNANSEGTWVSVRDSNNNPNDDLWLQAYWEPCDDSGADFTGTTQVEGPKAHVTLRFSDNNPGMQMEVFRNGSLLNTESLTTEPCLDDSQMNGHFRISGQMGLSQSVFSGEIYDYRHWDKQLTDSKISLLASADGNTEEGSELSLYTFGDDITGSLDTQDADLSASLPGLFAKGVKTNWTKQATGFDVVTYSTTPSNDFGRIRVHNHALSTNATFESCAAEDNKDQPETPNLAVTYDDWYVNTCASVDTDSNYINTYTKAKEQVGSLQFSTCDSTNTQETAATLLERINFVDREGCWYEADSVTESVFKRQQTSIDQDVEISHETAEDQFVAFLGNDGSPPWEILRGIGDETIVEGETEGVAIEIWNTTVYTFESIDSNTNEIRKWELFKNATGDWTLPDSPNSSEQTSKDLVFGGLELSKDGRFLLLQHASDVALRDANDLSELVSMPTSEIPQDADIDPCNNWVYVVDDGGSGQKAQLNRYNVSTFTNTSAGGDGGFNPCPAQKQALLESKGEPAQAELSDELEGDSPQSQDTGLVGQNTLNASANALGVNVTGAKIFYAGLLIAGMALSAAAFSRKEGFGNGGSGAVAGALGGSVISLGLGLLPVWFFVLIGIGGLAIVFFARR